MLSTDCRLVIEKVEGRLEGRHAKVLLRWRRLVFLRLVLAAIPIFNLLVFKLPMSLQKRL